MVVGPAHRFGMSDLESTPTMDELMAQVGYLLLHWGWLEAEMRSKGREFSRHTDDPDFALTRQTRNLVAHCMAEATVKPTDGEAHIICISIDGDEKRITISDLKRATGMVQARLIQERQRPAPANA